MKCHEPVTRHGLSGECSYKNADQVQGKKEYGATKAALPWQRHYLGSPFGGFLFLVLKRS